jgi:hypothetical protein
MGRAIPGSMRQCLAFQRFLCEAELVVQADLCLLSRFKATVILGAVDSDPDSAQLRGGLCILLNALLLRIVDFSGGQ